MSGGKPSANGTQKNGDKGGAFHQRIAGGQLLAPQMIGKNAEFGRTKERGENAETEQGAKQQRQRSPHVAPCRDGGHENLHELQALRHPGLVVTVCKLPTKPGQEKKRSDEDCPGGRNQSFRVADARLEQDDKDKCSLEKIVVECREELAPEKRGKFPGQQQGCRHAVPLLQSSGRPALAQCKKIRPCGRVTKYDGH